MDRRTFAQLLPVLFAATALDPGTTTAQAVQSEHTTLGQPTVGPGGEKPHGDLPLLTSGVFTPGPAYGSQPMRTSHRYLIGMLKAGNIQLEIHETHQEVGAPHEPIDKHLHSEVWLVREGTCELTTNGITRRMQAGDVGLCVAGDLHYIRNAGDTPCTYFVVTLGPPERYS